MASTFTANIGIEQPGNGDYVNNWSTPVNNDWALIDQAFGSSTTVPLSSSDVTLTVAQSAFFQITCTGVLTANVKLILPAAIGGRRVIFNQCTGAFSLTVLNGAGDSGGGVVVGQGYQTPVVLTAGRAWYDAYGSTPPGTLLPFAGTTAPPGFLLTFGQAISRSTYSALFQAIGTVWGSGDGSTTFNLPDFRGRLIAGADNMGGSAAGNLTGYVVGSTGGEQTHLLTTPEMPSHNHVDSGHGHTVTDPGHTHAPGSGTDFMVRITGGGQGTLTNGGNPNQEPGGNSASATTGITNQTGHAVITNTGGGLSHNNVQPTAAVNVMIRF